MKNFKKLSIIMLSIMGIALTSCGEVCVRCENGATGEVETKCFADDGERDEYALTREAQGFTCNDE